MTIKRMYAIYDTKRCSYGDIRLCDNDLDAYKDYYLNNLKYIRENPTEKFDDNILVYLGSCDISNYRNKLECEDGGVVITKQMVDDAQSKILKALKL